MDSRYYDTWTKRDRRDHSRMITLESCRNTMIVRTKDIGILDKQGRCYAKLREDLRSVSKCDAKQNRTMAVGLHCKTICHEASEAYGSVPENVDVLVGSKRLFLPKKSVSGTVCYASSMDAFLIQGQVALSIYFFCQYIHDSIYTVPQWMTIYTPNTWLSIPNIGFIFSLLVILTDVVWRKSWRERESRLT